VRRVLGVAWLECTGPRVLDRARLEGYGERLVKVEGSAGRRLPPEVWVPETLAGFFPESALLWASYT
jgi:hypothetical protein